MKARKGRGCALYPRSSAARHHSCTAPRCSRLSHASSLRLGLLVSSAVRACLVILQLWRSHRWATVCRCARRRCRTSTSAGACPSSSSCACVDGAATACARQSSAHLYSVNPQLLGAIGLLGPTALSGKAGADARPHRLARPQDAPSTSPQRRRLERRCCRGQRTGQGRHTR